MSKVAIITGGAQGLGKAYAEALLGRGIKVCLADVNTEIGEATVKTLQQNYGTDSAFFIQCDVTKQSDLQATFEATKRKYGRIDIVVNNAGIANEVDWVKMVDINLKGVIMGTQLAVDVMRTDKGGYGGIVINIASTAGIVPVFTTPVYVATKFGVVGFTRSMANNQHLADVGVKFACLCPAFAYTDIIKFEIGKNSYPDASRGMMKQVGIMQLSQVVGAFEQLLDMPNNNGVVMSVTKQDGVQIKWKKRSKI